VSTVVVVEAPERSGALMTVRHGLDAGRYVWAVPGPPGVRECRGSNGLLAGGAGVLWDIPEFVEAVAPRDGAASETPLATLPVGLPEAEAAVLSRVGLELYAASTPSQGAAGWRCPRCSPRSPC